MLKFGLYESIHKYVCLCFSSEHCARFTRAHARGRGTYARGIHARSLPRTGALFGLRHVSVTIIYRAVPSGRIQGKGKVDFDGVKSSPDRQSSYEQALDPNTYLELKARPSNHEQSMFQLSIIRYRKYPRTPNITIWCFTKKMAGNKMKKYIRKYDNPQIIFTRTDMTTIGFWSRKFISQFTPVRL